ncbi:SusC/RagA family TonB-linked outer membrane protein [Siphonobacter sp. SORGH_AS_1065]|uniref:SusC/RagA family TonB-linked outer membrane protein n=1 Tax=Siphonobacter sp. SORGH_AS_1065 TaxID=3041795 RepID=UPI00277EE658|nr:SusC/RagA family TonB-linked outer membrane protein [Siphonobacter sp. SORGH_AS_1065]MDQ1090130.1 TonB-linked SusC/RagA family outer membrane protein [Siphonobacter sp. SORGH_AS_1065]
MLKIYTPQTVTYQLMRFTVYQCFLVLWLASMTFAHTNYAQGVLDRSVTISIQNLTLKQTLQQLEAKASVRFVYSSSWPQMNQKVTVSTVNTSLNQVLEKVLTPAGMTFQPHANSNMIVIKPLKSTSSTDVPLEIQREVSGQVVSADNDQPMIGVSVRVKGTSQGTVTNDRGEFRITTPDKGIVLIFSYVGYETREVGIGTQSYLKVDLKPKDASLNDVVVIGYGTTTQRYNTGAVSSITAKDISVQTISNPLVALQGRIAGAQITQNNGLPGSSVRIQIRGQGSLSSGTVPLYVVDGVPFTLFNGGQPANDNLNAYGISGANGEQSPLSLIPPEDIERIDVLKDADATAIYGSRGSNGVILITTKKGKAGRTQFNVNVNSGAGKVPHYIPMLNTEQYLSLRKEAFARAKVTPNTSNAPDLTLWDQNANTDWQRKYLGGTAQFVNASASVSGGNAFNSFLFSGLYRKEGTVFPGNLGATTLSGRFAGSHTTANQKFRIDFTTSYSHLKNNLVGSDLTSVYSLAPNYPLYNADGSLNWTGGSNPEGLLMQEFDNVSTNFITQLNLKYTILPGLDVKINNGYTLTGIDQIQVNPARSQNPLYNPISSSVFANNKIESYIVEPQVDYRKAFGKSQINVLVGGTFQQSNATGQSIEGRNYTNDALLKSLIGAGTILVTQNNYSLYKYTSAFGRVNYSWDNKYILNGTFRRDGSSRFGPSHRFGNFGAIGAAWLVSSEEFMKTLPWFSYLKLRSSYGLTGNDQIPNYAYLPTYQLTSSTNVYSGTATLVNYNIPNPTLHWETTRKLEVALEMGFFHDRILLKSAYFRNRSGDQLASTNMPTQSGVNSFSSNLDAVIQNKGFEFELNTINVATAALRWSTNINFTFLRNKLLSIGDPKKLFNSSSYTIGQPVNATRLYQYTGLDANGLPTVQDIDGDGVINFNKDRVMAPIGNPFFGGINNSLSYKNFQLDVFLRFNHRMGYQFNFSDLYGFPLGNSVANKTTAALNRWSESNPNGVYPAATTLYSSAFSYYSSSNALWGDASFLKLSTVSLSYNLPAALIQPLQLSKVSVYVQGQNMFTWAKQKYILDPETSLPGTGTGLGSGQFQAVPQLRTIVAGLNVSF